MNDLDFRLKKEYKHPSCLDIKCRLFDKTESRGCQLIFLFPFIYNVCLEKGSDQLIVYRGIDIQC